MPFHYKAFVLLFLASLLAGCNAGPNYGTQPVKVAYSELVADVLVPQCVSCHSDVNPAGGVSFASYSSTMASPGAVVPFQAYASQMYRRTVKGEMPPGARLSNAQLEQIYNWISLGALND